MVASLDGDNSLVFYYLSASEIWLDKMVASLDGDNSLVFYYLSTSEIWPDKMVASLEGGQFISILLSQYI
jgi:hypothetical protein